MLTLQNLNKEYEQWTEQITTKPNYFSLSYVFVRQGMLLGETITIHFHHCLRWSQDFIPHVFHVFFPLNVSNGSSRQNKST